MRFVGDCYRAHDPQWTFAASSGDGAALFGGRFNQPGVPALYLALSLEGAVKEVAQDFSFKLEPLTICLYEVDCEDVVDLRTPDSAAANGFDATQLGCAWRFDEAAEPRPYSWHVAGTLKEKGASRILVQSFAPHAKPDAFNIVLWRWGKDLPYRVSVHDPANRLPLDESSWPTR